MAIKSKSLMTVTKEQIISLLMFVFFALDDDL